MLDGNIIQMLELIVKRNGVTVCCCCLKGAARISAPLILLFRQVRMALLG